MLKGQILIGLGVLCVWLSGFVTAYGIYNAEYKINLNPKNIEIKGVSPYWSDNKVIVLTYEESDTISLADFFILDNQ